MTLVSSNRRKEPTVTARKKSKKRDEDLAPTAAAHLREPVSEPAWGSKSTDLITEARRPGSLRDTLRPARMLSLQRAAGNKAVNELVAALNEPGRGWSSPALGLVRARRATAGSPLPVQRAITTNGGEFDTGYYSKIEQDKSASKKRIGSKIKITFSAGKWIRSNQIGLTQTVKAMKSTSLTGPVDTRATARLSKGAEYESALHPHEGSDVGRGIDRVVFATDKATKKETSVPIINPMYGVGAGADVSDELGDTPASGNAHFGSRKYDVKTKATTNDPAWLTDAPARTITMKKVKVGGADVLQPSARFELTFETAALVLEGRYENVYLGSVSWGWKSDDHGNVTLEPFGLVSAGAPTQAFMDAARKWNTLKFKDKASGALHETVSLPITSFDHPAALAADMSTSDLVARAAYLSGQEATAKVAKDTAAKAKDQHAVKRANVRDVANLDFERTIVRDELRNRKIHADLTATPPADAKGDLVLLNLVAGTHGTTVASSRLTRGAKTRTTFNMADLLNATGPLLKDNVTLKTQIKQGASTTSLFNVVWALPLRPFNTTQTKGAGTYDVDLSFNK
jgi:hypothetical protein